VTPSDLDTHYDDVVKGLLRGRVTPVLGAGVNLCGRPPTGAEGWIGKFPPSGPELAQFLATEFEYPPDRPADLLQVCQYVYAVRGGSGPLYDQLHDIFDATFPTTPVHDFLARLPAAVRERTPPGRPPVILTTNYDDLMEAALAQHGEDFDVVVYSAEGPNEGRFCVRPPGGNLEPIADPATNLEINPETRTVVLKIHGFVDRENAGADDSFVITEDHYIEYLTRMDLDNLIPLKVLERLRNCHFLFLGYSLRDWNLRAILYKLWTDARIDRDWWAIQVNPDELEKRSWGKRGVDIFDVDLDEYTAALAERFDASLAR
jgi:SIR2-like domain